MEDIFEKSFVVYLLTDLTNFKQYVGKTTNKLKIRLSKENLRSKFSKNAPPKLNSTRAKCTGLKR